MIWSGVLQTQLAALRIIRSGYLGGSRSADRLCRHDAKKNYVAGTFHAFLNSESRSLDSAIQDTYLDLPVVNVKVGGRTFHFLCHSPLALGDHNTHR